MVDPADLPGASTPGPQTPGPNTPGQEIPDESPEIEETVSATGVATDATGTTTLGTPDGRDGRVRTVTLDATSTDFQFDLLADGVSLFAATQSPSSTDPETFDVPVEAGEFTGQAPTLAVEITSASAQGGASADVDATVAVTEQ